LLAEQLPEELAGMLNSLRAPGQARGAAVPTSSST
jgi:hypothetical protein